MAYSIQEIQSIIEAQKAFFRTGTTLDIDWRLKQLRTLRDAVAARKIAFFKLCNAGQICININQIAVAEEIAGTFLEALKAAFVRQVGVNAQDNDEYPWLITPQAYEKCSSMAEEYRDRIVFGGTGNPDSRRYAPTVIYPVGIDEDIAGNIYICLHENIVGI